MRRLGVLAIDTAIIALVVWFVITLLNSCVA